TAATRNGYEDITSAHRHDLRELSFLGASRGAVSLGRQIAVELAFGQTAHGRGQLVFYVLVEVADLNARAEVLLRRALGRLRFGGEGRGLRRLGLRIHFAHGSPILEGENPNVSNLGTVGNLRRVLGGTKLAKKEIANLRRCIMARINGLDLKQASWLTRLLYWFTRRALRRLTGKDRLLEPVKIAAYHPRLLRAASRMEMAQPSARTVDARL